MKRIIPTCAMVLLFIFILASQKVTAAAREGLSLCIATVIPSLLPFMILSGFIRQQVTGEGIRLLRPIGKLCHIPCGSEILWLLGILGGYPLGAQCINEAYKHNTISKNDGVRMLGFCCNCGPAFIFGFLSGVLNNRQMPWIIWTLHIAASLLLGMLIPKKLCNQYVQAKKKVKSADILSTAVRSLAMVCVWVILFRILIAFLLPNDFLQTKPELKTLLSGFMELTNGCLALESIHNQGMQLILAATMLGFGGLCVAIQTISVTHDIGIGVYFPGKIAQSGLSFLLSYLYQLLILPQPQHANIPLILPIIAVALTILAILHLRKKVVDFQT